jgi:hypothetical protein
MIRLDDDFVKIKRFFSRDVKMKQHCAFKQMKRILKLHVNLDLKQTLCSAIVQIKFHILIEVLPGVIAVRGKPFLQQ